MASDRIALLLAGGVAALITATPATFAQTAANVPDAHGFFWYITPPPPPRLVPIPPPPTPVVQVIAKPPKKAPPPVVVVKEGPAVLSAKWLRINMPKYLARALDNPTPKNVAAYYYLQKVMFDRAQNFADEASYVTKFTASLNQNNFIPMGNGTNNAVLNLIRQSKNKVIRMLSKKVGIWFFFKSDCPYCKLELPLVNQLVRTYGLSAVYISMNGKRLAKIPRDQIVMVDHGQAKRLGLVETPAVVMVWPPNNFVVLAQGMTTVQGLETEMEKAAAYMDLVPQHMLDQLNPYRRGVMTPRELNAIGRDRSMSPTAISSYVNHQTLRNLSNYSGSAPYTVSPDAEGTSK
ncbi:MAG: conjugal transfer protein TraF [Acidiphilium sp.]|nr:conjugal transfer protein TraF [Acidiphilium sp.]